jgi:hypothetical protein
MVNGALEPAADPVVITTARLQSLNSAVASSDAFPEQLPNSRDNDEEAESRRDDLDEAQGSSSTSQ